MDTHPLPERTRARVKPVMHDRRSHLWRRLSPTGLGLRGCTLMRKCTFVRSIIVFLLFVNGVASAATAQSFSAEAQSNQRNEQGIDEGLSVDSNVLWKKPRPRVIQESLAGDPLPKGDTTSLRFETLSVAGNANFTDGKPPHGKRAGVFVAKGDPLAFANGAISEDRSGVNAGWAGHAATEALFERVPNLVLPISAEIDLDPTNPQPPPPELAALSRTDCESPEVEVELERYKRQALQSLSLEFGGVSRFESDSLQNGFLEIGIGTGIPLGSLDHILGLTPRVRVDWLDLSDQVALPAGYELPSDLYQFDLQFFYRRSLSERLSVLAIVSPAIRSDLSTDDRAMRLFALGLLNWEWIPDRVTLSGGAVMLGRADLPVLPALGLMWTPNRRTRLDLRFPLAKAGYRLTKDGGNSETWAYISGGLGGTTWAVTKADGQTDEFSLRDYRLFIGWERLVSGGGGCFTELGVALGRRVEWERPHLEVEFPSAAMIQAGWRY